MAAALPPAHHDAERPLAHLLSQLPGLVYRCRNDEHWTAEFISEGVYALTGYRAEEFLQHRIAYASLIHPRDRRRVHDEIQAALSERRMFQLSYCIITASGQERSVWEQGTGIFNSDGTLAYLEGFVGDATDRQRAADSIARERDFSAAVLDSLPGAFYMLDTQGSIVRWNRPMEQTSGYTREELSGMPALKLFSGNDCQRVAEKIAEVFAVGAAEVEADLVSKDGRRTPYYFSGRRVTIDEQAFLVGMGIDISARVKAEESVRVNEQRLRGLIDGLGPSVFVGMLTPDGVVVEVNEPALALGALSRLDVGGRFLADTHWWAGAGASREQLLVALERAKRGQGSRFDAQVCGIGGKMIHVDFSIQPVCDENGEVVFLVPSAIDITDRKQADARLRESEERFRLLVENSSDLINIVDREGCVRFQSPSVERILGYKPGELAGRRLRDVVHQDDVSPLGSLLDDVLSQPERPLALEFRCRHSDGTWRIMETLAKAMPDKVGEQLILLNSRDVTESRRLSEQLRQAQKLEAIGQLSGGIAHDFNNILTVIQGHACLLGSEPDVSADVHEAAREINNAADRAANLTRQLLTFSRRQVIQLRNVDVNGMVARTTKMLQRIVGEDITIALHLGEGPLMIHADAGMIDQLLLNLAANARDAMPHGGQFVVETAATCFDEAMASQTHGACPGDYVCLSVSDTGTGIAKEHIPHIFEPFFTTKDVGKGTGLGLATVYGIVQQHGGWISVYSEVNHGTTFRIYLPRVKTSPSQHSEPKPSLNEMLGSETVLLVEDETAVRVMMRRFLSGLGYRIIEADTGVAALRLWAENCDRIDLLVTDLVMPEGMTGMELASRMQASVPTLPVIYMSGYSADVVHHGAQLVEGENFLQKPCSPARLAQLMRQRLGASRASGKAQTQY